MQHSTDARTYARTTPQRIHLLPPSRSGDRAAFVDFELVEDAVKAHGSFIQVCSTSATGERNKGRWVKMDYNKPGKRVETLNCSEREKREKTCNRQEKRMLPTRSLFVGNLSPLVKEWEIRAAFEAFGKVEVG